MGSSWRRPSPFEATAWLGKQAKTRRERPNECLRSAPTAAAAPTHRRKASAVPAVKPQRHSIARTAATEVAAHTAGAATAARPGSADRGCAEPCNAKGARGESYFVRDSLRTLRSSFGDRSALPGGPACACHVAVRGTRALSYRRDGRNHAAAAGEAGRRVDVGGGCGVGLRVAAERERGGRRGARGGGCGHAGAAPRPGASRHAAGRRRATSLLTPPPVLRRGRAGGVRDGPGALRRRGGGGAQPSARCARAARAPPPPPRGCEG